MNILIIFAKNPLQLPVKTRLASGIGKTRAVEFYRHVLNKVITNTNSKSYLTKLCVKGGREYFDVYGKEYVKDAENSLGEIMWHAIKEEILRENKIVLIGSDIPDITEKDIELAFQILEKRDVVIGPCLDGGYYLIGMKEKHNLFTLDKWSDTSVLKKTLDIIKKKNLTYALLEEKRDIDTVYDYEFWKQKNEIEE